MLSRRLKVSRRLKSWNTKPRFFRRNAEILETDLAALDVFERQLVERDAARAAADAVAERGRAGQLRRRRGDWRGGLNAFSDLKRRIF